MANVVMFYAVGPAEQNGQDYLKSAGGSPLYRMFHFRPLCFGDWLTIWPPRARHKWVIVQAARNDALQNDRSHWGKPACMDRLRAGDYCPPYEPGEFKVGK